MTVRLLAAALVFGVASAASAQVLFFEDFEGVTLGPSPEEQPIPPVPVISADPPAGWTVDDSGVPGIGDQDNGGIDDWEGWAFVDEAFWVAADDQRRSEFRDGLGEGVVAVADADEWDDVNSPADNIGFYNAFMTSPAIDISGAPGLEIEFGSSWRDEAFDDDGVAGDPSDDNMNNQTAILSLIIDGGAPTEILRWESDPDSAFFKDDAPNELVTIQLPGVTGSTAQLEFGLVQAGNDWWWAVDNVEVSVLPEPTSAVLLAMGLLAATRRR